jgi:cation diffusion facilitator family transporter
LTQRNQTRISAAAEKRQGYLVRPANITTLASFNIVVALLVTGLKYIAYAKTGSIALYSDALESVVNVVTAVAALVAVNISQRPPDRSHPYGHHKAEYFAVALEGWLIVAAALLIIHDAYAGWLAPRAMTLPAQGLIINTAATLINAAWARVLLTQGRRLKSPALVADGWHIVTDVVTSIGVLVGLGLALLTGWTFLDPLLAAVVALNILWAGWRLTTESVRGLMDESVTAEIMARIRTAIAANAEGALQVHDLKTRIAGRATFIECHLVVPGNMTVARSHEICDRIEAAVKDTVDGAEVVIHVEPEDHAEPKGALII